MQFSLIPQEDGRFSFQVQGESNNPILNSPIFLNRENCIASIRGFIDQIRDPEATDIREEAGQFHFILKDETGEVWMKSLNFEEKEDVESLVKQLQAKASDNTSFEVSMRRQRSQKLPALPKEINYEELYDFGLVSRSKKMGFHTLQSKKNQKFYFLFNDDAGTPILYSRSFSTPAQRDKRIRAIIKQSDKRHKYEVLQNAAGTYFILKGNNGKEIARSATFPDETQAESALNLIKEKAITFSRRFPEPPKTPRKVVNKYRLDQASRSGLTGFDPFQSDDNLHYFHFNDAQGQALLFSEGYTTSRSRTNGIKSLIKNAGLQNRYVIKEDTDTPYFVVRAGNRQEIARSKVFASKKELQDAIDWLKIQIPRYAAQFGVSLDTGLNENFTIEVGIDDVDEEILIPEDTPQEEKTDSQIPKQDTSSTSLGSGKATGSSPGELSLLWERVWPWLLVALALFLLYLLLKNCATGTQFAPEKPAQEKNETVIAAAPVETEDEKSDKDETLDLTKEDNAEGTTNTPRNEEKKEEISANSHTARLDTGNPATSAFNFPAGSMLAKMEAFLGGSKTGKSPTYRMDHARFPYNSPKLNKAGNKELDELTKLLNAYPSARVHIYGHLDLNEDDYYSGPFAEEFLTLSAIRARCIYRKLIERGVAEERLTFKGFANQQPLENEINPINRRLELVLEK